MARNQSEKLTFNKLVARYIESIHVWKDSENTSGEGYHLGLSWDFLPTKLKADLDKTHPMPRGDRQEKAEWRLKVLAYLEARYLPEDPDAKTDAA